MTVKTTMLAALAAVGSLTVSPAHADVKAGVDAWQQGDHAGAVAQWRPLAIAGDADAQFNLGQAYKLGRGVPMDLATALDWFGRAAAQGHERAADNYGLLLFQQGRRSEALPYIRRSADRGEPRAQYILGTALFNGDLVGKDWPRAYALMTSAASSGLDQARNSLAEMDKYIPEDQRRRGQAMATKLGKANGSGPADDADRPADTPAASPYAAPAPVKKEPTAKFRLRPDPPVIAKAPAGAPPTATGRWRIQLGAFREPARARALWAQLKSRLPVLGPVYVGGGDVTRLQAGPVASVAEAERLCGRLRTAGFVCVPKAM